MLVRWPRAKLQPANGCLQASDSMIRNSHSPSLIGVPLTDVRDVAKLVEAGADLFYCGLQLTRLREEFGAWGLENGRDNPKASVGSVASLRELSREVRGHGRPLMLAMNRTYPESARPHIEAALAQAADAGVDGFILGDLAVAAFLRARWPNVKLVASTFLGLHNRPGLLLAGRLGFDRVVLPRAMRLDEIDKLAAVDLPGLEVFAARERCRFVNAYCRLEHALPDPIEPGRLRFPSKPLCATPLIGSGGKPWQIEHEAAAMEACGLCAVGRLAGRVQVFKFVGRGGDQRNFTNFISAARRILDQVVPPRPEQVQDIARGSGIRCTLDACHYPDVRNLPPGPRLRLERPVTNQFPEVPAAQAESPEVLVALPATEKLLLPLPAQASGAWLGHETCVHLLPSPAQLRGSLSRVASAGLRPALVLPPLFGNADVAKGLKLVEVLASVEGPRTRVTANDIGTLVALRDLLGPDAELIIGRVMVAQRTDPRLRRGNAGENLTGKAHALPLAHLDSIAATCGARRIEVSTPGAWPPFDGRLIEHATLHVGPALNAVSRACHTLANFYAEIHGVRPFLVPSRCSRPCVGRDLELRLHDGPEVFWSCGNALYSEPGSPGPIPTWVDRVILHPFKVQKMVTADQGQAAADDASATVTKLSHLAEKRGRKQVNQA